MVHWLNPMLQRKVEYRPGDTILSVPVKSGTTWMMNIFHQLRMGGDESFADVYEEVPWIEFKEHPEQTDEELLERWSKLPTDIPRAFKSHSAPGDGTMGDFAVYREDMKYVVVMRNPEEAITSFYPFLKKHSMEIWELWDAVELRDQIIKPDFETFFREVILKGFPNMPPEIVPPGGLLTMLFFGFINTWWPLREKANVLMIHFNDLKNDHEGSIRRIAEHLSFTPSEEEWSKILENTGFPWMKAHQEKFEIPKILPFKLLESGGMVRKGQAGHSHDDGMTDEMAAIIREWAEKMIPDKAALKWMYEGGSME